MDKSTCIMKTYHTKIDKLQCWEKRPFYATYAPRTRIEEHETSPLLVSVQPYNHNAERAVAVLVAVLLILVALGVLLAVFFS